MTRDEINRAILDNGWFHGTVSIGAIMDINHLEGLIAFAEAKEREACARVCEEFVMGSPFAAAIRARGDKE